MRQGPYRSRRFVAPVLIGLVTAGLTLAGCTGGDITGGSVVPGGADLAGAMATDDLSVSGPVDQGGQGSQDGPTRDLTVAPPDLPPPDLSPPDLTLLPDLSGPSDMA